ncbi:hypothetical protein BV22DRAFT_1127946 [Leucogyrophana mollusca]|uniref:Uncharacterized protein n=1 Tax=Leucogyrophana mollusca TaxID=85980 RepID=A0ACB8BNJ3_9AGAM|nr:hypothetical protein BV22DRAFT_1127946 [Leucogyrophana mollusca]
MASSWLELPALAVGSFLDRGERELFGGNTRSRFTEGDWQVLAEADPWADQPSSPNINDNHSWHEEHTPAHEQEQNPSSTPERRDTIPAESKTRRWMMVAAAAALAIGGVALVLARLSTDDDETLQVRLVSLFVHGSLDQVPRNRMNPMNRRIALITSVRRSSKKAARRTLTWGVPG